MTISKFAELAAEKLSNLSERLEDNLNKQEESASESFIIYLEYCKYAFDNKGSIREVFDIIKKTTDGHARAQVNKTHPDTKDPDREKAMKLKRQEVSDKMTLTGNKILQFLVDIKDNRITHNEDYRVLQLSLNEEQRDSLSTWITALPDNEEFQNVIEPEKIEEEQIFLTVTNVRNNLISISDRVVETIKSFKKTHKEKTHLTIGDIDKYWQENHSHMKPLSGIQCCKVLECYQMFSNSVPIVQSNVQTQTQTVNFRCSLDRLVKSNPVKSNPVKPLLIKTTSLVKRRWPVSNRNVKNCRKRISHVSSSQKNPQRADVENLDAAELRKNRSVRRHQLIDTEQKRPETSIDLCSGSSDATPQKNPQPANSELGPMEEEQKRPEISMDLCSGSSDATPQKNPQPANSELGPMEEEQKRPETSIDNQLVEAVELFSKQLILWDLSEQELVVLGRRLVKCLGEKSKATNIKAILHIDGLHTFVKPLESTGDLNIAMPAVTIPQYTDTASADHIDEIFRLNKAVDRIVPAEIIDGAEVIKVNHILLNEADRSSSDRQLEACVLSLYLHAIRVHAMTHQCFLDKPSYNRFQDYLQHREFLLKFENDNFSFNLDSVRHSCGFTPYSGDRMLTNVINHFFPNRGLQLIQNVSFPKRNSLEENPITITSKVVLDAIKAGLGRSDNVDMSVIFIDLLQFDAKRRREFPNRFVLTHENNVFAYQTIGAVYKSMVDGQGQYYAHRILSRGRNSGNYFLHDYFYDQDLLDYKKSAPVCYRDRDLFDSSGYRLSKKKNCRSMFPPDLKGSNTKYFLEGVVMCLNEAQRDGDVHTIRTSVDESDYQLTLSQLDPVPRGGGPTLHAREMEILESTTGWLTDEIISVAMSTFMKRINYSETLVSDPMYPVVINPFVFLPLLASLNDAPSIAKAKRLLAAEKLLAKKVVDAQLFESGYQKSQSLWNYRNLFSRKSWFFSIINYPDNAHWILLGLHSGDKIVFIHDPLHSDQNEECVKTIVEHYINREATEYCKLGTTVGLHELQWEAWNFSSFRAQQQADSYNCGVFSLIAFFRSLKLSLDNVSFHDIVASWSIPITPTTKTLYRLMLKQMLLVNGGEDVAFEFFLKLIVT